MGVVDVVVVTLGWGGGGGVGSASGTTMSVVATPGWFVGNTSVQPAWMRLGSTKTSPPAIE
jgi:hypothetical protein